MSFLARIFGRYPKLTRTVDSTSQTFESGLWSVRLPAEWRVQPGTHAVSIETTDKAKGLLIQTLVVGTDAVASEIATDIVAVCKEGLQSMAGYSWAYLQDSQIETPSGLIAVLDAHDSKMGYRICTKVVVRQPYAIRASFHDYGCENFAASQAYFAGPIESLQVSGAGA